MRQCKLSASLFFLIFCGESFEGSLAFVSTSSSCLLVPPWRRRRGHGTLFQSPGANYSNARSIALSTLRLWKDDSNDSEQERVRRANDSRVDVRNLLTQRAIQSFLYLLTMCRDPHSGKWIEDFLQTRNSLEYHGTGAGYIERFGGTWHGPLSEMTQQPKDVVIVSAKRRGRGHGGWSKDNPYLEDRYVEFEIDIDPVSLASRILSVREQISKEWISDLDILDEANRNILDSYFGRVKSRSEQQLHAFERTAVNILNNHTAFSSQSSSPFRKGSFDLLYNLCTQAAIHQLLRDYAEGGQSKEVPLKWLRNFYMSRVETYFDGDQPYGRADDFLDELLRSSPSVLLSEGGKGPAVLADPLLLAEDIIRKRSSISKHWKALLKRVPDDHAEIRKLILAKQVEKWSSGKPMGGFE
jgi:hypothetical protein